MVRRPKLYKRIVTGASATGGVLGATAGFGIDTALVPTDAGNCQKLLDLIDDKRVFYDPVAWENGRWSLKSVAEVRKMATATASLMEAEEGVGEVKHIATACRRFM